MAKDNSTFRSLVSSESNEWYTPRWLIEIVKGFYGGTITLDPCTCQLAQSWINAEYYWTKAMCDRAKIDPLNLRWDVIKQNDPDNDEVVKMWMNPIYGPKAGKWISKAVYEWKRERVPEQLILVRGDSNGIKQLRKLAIICEFNSRIAFIDSQGRQSKNPVPGVRLFYLGSYPDHFHQTFQPFGDIMQVRKLFT